MLKVSRIKPNAVIPSYANEGDACFDIFGTDFELQENNNTVVIGTGLKFEIPKGWAMMIYSRSGQGFNHDTRLSNCVGVIDSGYRGEVKVKLIKDSPVGDYPLVDLGKAVAQAMLIRVATVSFIEVESLDQGSRGENGFGSSDKA